MQALSRWFLAQKCIFYIFIKPTAIPPNQVWVYEQRKGDNLGVEDI